MNENKPILGSDLNKIDAHIITAEEYAEIPELSEAFFTQADLHIGGKLIQRGKINAKERKVLLSIPYSPEVVNYFRATGAGWQNRMDEALKEWMKEHVVMG